MPERYTGRSTPAGTKPKNLINMKAKPLFGKLNIVHSVCNHVLSSKHTYGHRMLVGSFFIVAGLLTGEAIHFTSFALIILCKGTTAILHGIGTIPFIEFAASDRQVSDIVAQVDSTDDSEEEQLS